MHLLVVGSAVLCHATQCDLKWNQRTAETLFRTATGKQSAMRESKQKVVKLVVSVCFVGGSICQLLRVLVRVALGSSSRRVSC